MNQQKSNCKLRFLIWMPEREFDPRDKKPEFRRKMALGLKNHHVTEWEVHRQTKAIRNLKL